MIFIMLGKEKFMVGEAIGFVLLVTGTLIYNEILEVPIESFRRNTKQNIESRLRDQKQMQPELLKKNSQENKNISNVNTQSTL
jgi:hypothetical protein